MLKLDMRQNEQIMTIVYGTKWTDNDNSIWDKMNR